MFEGVAGVSPGMIRSRIEGEAARRRRWACLDCGGEQFLLEVVELGLESNNV